MAYNQFSFESVQDFWNESRGIERDELYFDGSAEQEEDLAAARLDLLAKFHEFLQENKSKVDEWLPAVQALETHATKLQEYTDAHPTYLLQGPKMTATHSLTREICEATMSHVKSFDKKLGIAA